MLSKEDWTIKYAIPEFVDLEWQDCCKDQQFGIMDVVILDRSIKEQERNYLWNITRGYCLFATENVDLNDTVTKNYFESRMGQFLYSGDVQYFLDNEIKNYYPNPYGEKLRPNALEVNPYFAGKISCDGNYNMNLEGEFGEKFAQVAYWRGNIPLYGQQCIDLFLEYQKTGTVEIKLKVVLFHNGAIDDVKRIWEFDEDELSDVIHIENDETYGPAFFSILAKGTGSLNIISLHDRYSRRGHGFFLPGGERHVTQKREELFSYFEKGDAKPPFLIYFSGYRTQEGFEGYYMMRKFGCPFLLLTDPRSEGGSFYIGDDEIEQVLLKLIQSKIKELGFTSKDVIISGASMGTYGSLYYGSMIAPHALILAKPVANLGNVAKNERILRAGGFATSLDILLKNYGSLEQNAIEAFNNRLWSRFEKTDWSQTKFVVSYLYEDDYDPDGYKDILKHLKSVGVQVYGKGAHGRHTDNSATVMAWFKSQYNKILKEDFKRK